MKKACLSATLSALCIAALGTCVTATAASRSGTPIASSYALSAASKVGITDSRSLSPLTFLGQWTVNSGRMRHSSYLSRMAQPGQAYQDQAYRGQAYRTVRIQTAGMQAPLSWLNAMTLKLTANRQVLTEFLDMTGRDLGSGSMDEKDRSQPRD